MVKCCREKSKRSVVEKECCGQVLWGSVVGRCCEGVLWGSVVEKC